MITLTICLVIEALTFPCVFKTRNSHLLRDLKCFLLHFQKLKPFDSCCFQCLIVDSCLTILGKC